VTGTVHVVGTSGVGDALVALLADFQTELGINAVTFHKRSVTIHDRPRLKALLDKGATLSVDPGALRTVEELGLDAALQPQQALENAHVVVDCTPFAQRHKNELYGGLENARGFVALDADAGFGSALCQGINHQSLRRGADRYLRIPDVMAQGMATLVHALSNTGKHAVDDASFVCLRRGADVAAGSDMLASPAARAHDDGEFGTAAAREAHEVLHQSGVMTALNASELELNSQIMDVLHFKVRLKEQAGLTEVIRRLSTHGRVAMTESLSPNPVFGFARDHGYLGRLFNALVVSRPTLRVHRNNEVVGVAFVPADGTVLYSALAAAVWQLEPESSVRLLDVLGPYVFKEV